VFARRWLQCVERTGGAEGAARGSEKDSENDSETERRGSKFDQKHSFEIAASPTFRAIFFALS
jgi:hypothetical protein